MNNFLKYVVILSILTYIQCQSQVNYTTTKPNLNKFHVKKPLNSNYTRKVGERIRLECEFEYSSSENSILNQNDFTLYWVKNYQELVQPKKGLVHIIRKNMSSVLIIKKLEAFDSGSYMCMGEFNTLDNQQLNASSETTLIVNGAPTSNANNRRPVIQSFKSFKQSKNNQDFSDYLLSDLSDNSLNLDDDDDDDDNLNDEFPSLNPTIVENFDDKGFCEPYKGSICAGIITQNYSIYSTSAQQQDLIEERLRTIIPLLMSNKNNLSKRCSTFAIPSLCLFAFPLCDKYTKQPKQICRFDCKQLQQDICKNEYFNVKSLFESKLSDNLQSQSSNFLLDCNQLPPSSDSPNDCLPIVTMTLDKLESQVIGLSNKQTQPVQEPKCIMSNGVEYRGSVSVTRSGYTCQKWDEQYPHMHNFKNIPELSGHNYCRNLDNDVEPWCFTNNPQKRKDYCYIPKCADSNDIASVLSDNKLANLLYIVVPSVSIPFFLLFIVLIVCFCKKSKQTGDDKPQQHLSQNTSSGQASNQPIHPSKLRMSNVSIGNNVKKMTLQAPKFNSRIGESSKSSVTSSAHQEMNPFIKQQVNNYDNHLNYNPQFNQAHQIQQSNDFNMPLKQFSPNNFRLTQEIGKGIYDY